MHHPPSRHYAKHPSHWWVKRAVGALIFFLTNRLLKLSQFGISFSRCGWVKRTVEAFAIREQKDRTIMSTTRRAAQLFRSYAIIQCRYSTYNTKPGFGIGKVDILVGSSYDILVYEHLFVLKYVRRYCVKWDASVFVTATSSMLLGLMQIHSWSLPKEKGLKIKVVY